jgi:ribose transport system permease protein
LVALLVIVIGLSATQGQFLTLANWQNVLEANAALLLVSVGMTFVVISGGFDLSIGAMMALAQLFLVLFVNDAGMDPFLSCVLAVVGCGLIGALVNGVLIGVVGLNFFVTTLGTMILLQGIVLVASDGLTQILESDWLQRLGNDDVGIVPIPVLVCLAMLLIAWFVLQMTSLGRCVYSVGGNAEAARLSGVSVPWTVIAVYGISGACGGLAGVIDGARLVSASPTAGGTLALTSAAAVLLGGASLAGGVGKIAGTTIGVLVLATLVNGVDLFGVSSYWQNVVTGVALLLAIILDRAHKVGGLTLLAGQRTGVGRGKASPRL